MVGFRRGSPHQTGSLARWCEFQRVSARFASSDRQSGSLVRVPTSVGEVRLIRQAVWLVGASSNEFRRGSPHQTGSLARWCECQRVSARFASSDRQSGSLVRVPTSFGEVRLIRQAVWLVGASSNECRLGVGLRKYFRLRRDFYRSLVRVPTSVGLVLASESISGSAETFVAWGVCANVCAHGVERALSSRPNGTCLRSCGSVYVRMGWSELSRRAPMRHICAVVAACARMCVRRVEWRQE